MSMSDNENEILNDEHIDDVASAFMDLYKNSGKTLALSQEERRRNFLREQKEKRGAAFDEKRDLSQLFSSCVGMEVDPVNPVKRLLPFKYKLMTSELLKEVPADLAEKWLVKLCPEGIRYLVVAFKAVTTCYLRNGRSCLKFNSNLPGGNKGTGHKFTVLDCTYNKKSNTFFVFDVLAWNSMALIDSEAEMRFYWIKSKFEENPKLCEIRNSKSFRFALMDCLPAALPLLQDHLFTPLKANSCTLPYEGVLFYHKEGHYVFGSSPLVGWLKTFMVKEVLHIDVDPYHTKNKPENYENLDQYLGGKLKKKRHKIQNVEMEEAEDPEPDTKMCL